MSRNETVPGCYIDVFEYSGFKGRRRRLFGPGGIVSLRSSAAPPGILIASLIVGNGAHVCIYSAKDPERCCWFKPREGVQDLRQAHVEEDLDSVHIRSAPPQAGEPGYRAFVDGVIKDARG